MGEAARYNRALSSVSPDRKTALPASAVLSSLQGDVNQEIKKRMKKKRRKKKWKRRRKRRKRRLE